MPPPIRARYPEQIEEGLRPWQAPKIYKVGYYGFFRGEPEPPKGTKLVDRRVRRLRPAARPHVRRDRQRGACDAQVPGLRPAARAARIVLGEVPARRHDDSRTGREGRDRPARRPGSVAARPGAGLPAPRRRHGLVDGLPADCRRRRRRQCSPASANGDDTRRVRARARACRDQAPPRRVADARDERGRVVRDRLPARRGRRPCSVRRSRSPTAFGSKRWPTTAW